MKGLVSHKLPDANWGFPTVARIVPNEDHPWGVYRFLVGTDWEQFFPRVPVLTLDMALRGHATPLMKILGPPPRGFTKRLPVLQGQCAAKDRCINYTPLCVPGPKVPVCWEPAVFKGEESSLVANVVSLWREGVVVVVPIPEPEQDGVTEP